MTEINREARLARINLYNKNPVICRVCKKALPYDKRTNTFCSHSCSARYNNLGVNRHSASGVLIDKYCATCGKVLDQHNKIYCSIKCHKDHIHTEYIKNWLSGKNDGSRGIGEISRHISVTCLSRLKINVQSVGGERSIPLQAIPSLQSIT